MNILNAIGSGLRNVGQGIGTGALAAGKGLADYLNAQAMRQSGLTPEQLQQNPQLARSAMGNWLGSIGQGMQTGDYTGSRLGYQQEMLTKLQNLQAMKQQEAAKQRQAAFQQAMGQARTAEDLTKVAMEFPEYGEMVGKTMDQFKAVSSMNRDAAAIKLDEENAAVAKWKREHPGVQTTFKNPSTGTYFALFEDGSTKDTSVKVGTEYMQSSDGSGSLWQVPFGDGTTPSRIGDAKPKGLTSDQAARLNSSNLAAWKSAGGSERDFAPFTVNEGDALSVPDDVRASLGMAISARNAGRGQNGPSKTMLDNLPFVVNAVANGTITFQQGASALGGVKTMGGAILAAELAKADKQFFPPQVVGQLQEINVSRGLVDGLRSTINKVSAEKDIKKKTELALQLKGQADAITARLARANGEKGVLTDQDIQRASGLIPGWVSANFNKNFADQQLSLIEDNFNRVEKAIRGTYYPGAAAPPSTPPAATIDLNKFFKK